jgi:hypothetical protein
LRGKEVAMATAGDDEHKTNRARTDAPPVGEMTVYGQRIDLRKFLPYLDGSPLDERERLALIAEMVRFAQIILDGETAEHEHTETCGKPHKNGDDSGAEPHDVVGSDQSNLTTMFNDAAQPKHLSTRKKKEIPWMQ